VKCQDFFDSRQTQLKTQEALPILIEPSRATVESGMLLFAILGGLLLSAALIAREIQWTKERHSRDATHQELENALRLTRAQLRRTREDLYVFKSVLQERRLIDDAALLEGRMRLVENPRRKAEERARIVRNADVSPTQVVIDDGETIH